MLVIMRCHSASCLSSKIKSDHIFANNLYTVNRNRSRCLNSTQNSKHWSVLNDLYRKQFEDKRKLYACILLNIKPGPFENHFYKYKHIWNAANLKVAVDGSANTLAQNRLINTADIVCGDFDSADAKLIQKLRNPDARTRSFVPESYKTGPLPKLPQIIETLDQKETDFTKAVRVAISKIPKIQLFFALYQSNGSRIDHLFGLVNTLHLIKRDIILVNIKSNTISWLLGPGSHVIQKPRGRELCSIVPFNGPAKVRTRGLEYNISDKNPPLQFGGLISTSNYCLEDWENITIDTDREILWSVEVSAPKNE